MHRLMITSVAVMLLGLFLATLCPSPAASQTAAPTASSTDLESQYREAQQEIERLRRELTAAKATIARLQQNQGSPSSTSSQAAKAAPGQPTTYQEAIAVLTQVLEKNPEDIQALRKRGIAYAHIGKYPEALADLNQAIARNDPDAAAHNQRGIVHYKLGRYPEAMGDFNQAIAKQPKLAESYNNRGILYKTLGNYQRALADLRQANKLGLAYAPAAIQILRKEVKEVQQRLKQLGFDPGPADGLPGAATSSALRAYQRQQGLQVTGHLDNRTQQALGISPPPAASSQNATTEAILSRFIDKPALEYPLKARQEGLEGTVTLRFEMLADGTIGAIDVAKSSGHAILDTAAQTALKQWRHRPSNDPNQPAPAWATLDFNFTLDNKRQ